ncbi:elongation factor 2 [Aspergillus cavernicola]|uniref:Elongation factor 2 n=1 Tax=Aspergillus cavernicola TaxID=176166 RepID=A0ABR4IGB2_9EURO
MILKAVGHRRSSLSSLLASQASTPDDHHDNSPGDDGYNALTKQVTLSLCIELTKRLGGASQDSTNSNRYLLNLVDDPNSPSVPGAAALSLRITDGAIIALDAGSGIRSQTEGLLSAALLERNKVIILLDRVESPLTWHRQNKEDLYKLLADDVDSINIAIQKSIHAHGHELIDPTKGNIAFSSLLHGWAVNIPQLAARYGRKFRINPGKLAKRLWGDNFYDTNTKRWSSQRYHQGVTLERGFNMFILDPIFKIYDAVQGNPDEMQTTLANFGIKLNNDEQKLDGENLLHTVMCKFLPALDTVLEMACIHLPSPVTAQSYRAESLYQGPLDDEVGMGIRTCVPNAPLMLYISRTIPTSDKEGFYLLGRVFSGTVTPGQKVRVVHNGWSRRSTGTIEGVGINTSNASMSIQCMFAGNIVRLKTSNLGDMGNFTVTTSDIANRFRMINFADKAAIYITIDVKDPKYLPKLVTGLRTLSRSNPYVTVAIGETGEHELSGFDELQLQGVVEELKRLLGGIPIKTSQVRQRYREGIKAESAQICMSRSVNKKIHLFAKASPMPQAITNDIENGIIHTDGESKKRSKYLVEYHHWDRNKARKIWSFGPDNNVPNLLVESTVGVQYVTEIRDATVSGFQWATREGPICEEPLRSVRIDIMDATIMADSIYRGSGQLIPTMRRVVHGSVLRANPFLYEPVYHVEIHVPGTSVGHVYQVIEDRQGRVFKESSMPGSPMRILEAYIHVNQALGFPKSLSTVTGGSASCHLWFDHWKELEGDFEATVLGIRRRKGLSAKMPTWEPYCDTL